MGALRAALGGDSSVLLDVAALEMAAIERPDLDPATYTAMLDSMAGELETRVRGVSGAAFVRIANQYLFEDLRFHGNQAHYQDPRNSCLDFVLEQRTGIPITLSVLYIELARRLSQPVQGVGLPGHFVVQYDNGDYRALIDPFHAGRLLNHQDCRELVRDATGTDAPLDRESLRPVTTRYILVRMLNNLRTAYFRARRYNQAAAVMDLLVETFPSNPDYYKARGVARLHLRKLGASMGDLQTYLRLQPEAQDRQQVSKQLTVIHQWLGRLN